MIVDSWGSRGVSTDDAFRIKCTGQFFAERHVDLSGAIHYLKTLPFVKPNIGAVGLSQGGRTVIEASGWKKSAARSQLLSAAVGIYPSCGTPPKDVRIPLLILIGDADLITKASTCNRWLERYAEEIAQRLDSSSDEVGILPELIVYADVYHAYDLPITGNVLTPAGTVKADRNALKDTRKRMITFFKKHLDE